MGIGHDGAATDWIGVNIATVPPSTVIIMVVASPNQVPDFMGISVIASQRSTGTSDLSISILVGPGSILGKAHIGSLSTPGILSNHHNNVSVVGFLPAKCIVKHSIPGRFQWSQVGSPGSGPGARIVEGGVVSP